MGVAKRGVCDGASRWRRPVTAASPAFDYEVWNSFDTTFENDLPSRQI